MTRHPDHVPPTLDPEGDTPPAHPPRNVMRTQRVEQDGVTFAASRRSLSGLAKIVAALATVATALGAGWGGHRLASTNAEDAEKADVQAAKLTAITAAASAAAAQKSIEDHVALVAAERASIVSANEKRDADLANLKLDLAKHLSSIDTAMIFMQRDVQTMRETLERQPERRQPRSRPIAAPPRVDSP